MTEFSSRAPFVKKHWESDQSYSITERPQYNPTNPILAAFREREDVRNIYALRQWLAFLWDGWDDSICVATIAQQFHAHRVLTRLAKLVDAEIRKAREL